MVKTIEKLVKDAVKANKYKCGTKEVLQSIKGSRLIIVSNSVDLDSKSKFQSQSGSSNVPLYQFDGNSIKLGRLCNKPFRISVIALRTGTDTEINSVLSDKGKRES
jgi:large subunit ribosomal protein L30e